MTHRKRKTLTPANLILNLIVGIQNFKNLAWRIIKGAFLTFSNAKGFEAAASIAYYTLFSMFPLILSFVAIGSFLVDRIVVERELMMLIPRIIPVSQDFILTNIQQVFKQRGTVSIVALLSLLWSSTAVFSTIIRNINAAWPSAAPHSFIRMRLASLAIIGTMAVLLILSSFSLTLTNIIANLGIPLGDIGLEEIMSSSLVTSIIPNAARVLTFFGLYYWVPQIKVKKLSAFTGAVFASVVWQVVTIIFNAYLGSGFSNYEIVYGSLGKIIALLAWIYIIGYIILFGAHLTSSIDRHTR